MDQVSVSALTSVATPYVIAAAQRFGDKVFDPGSESATLDISRFGRELVHRLVDGDQSPQRIAIAKAIVDAIAAPHDPAIRSAIWTQIHEVFSADPNLALEIAGWREPTPVQGPTQSLVERAATLIDASAASLN